MKKCIAGLIFLLSLVPAPVSVLADTTLTLELDRSAAAIEDTIRMVVSLSGARKSESEPVIQGLEHFTLSRGGSSSRLEIINGQVSSGIDYTYFLHPKKAGDYRIGPAVVKVDGRTVKSNQASLAIKKASAASANDARPLFLTAELSKNNVFIEEQTIYTLKLYYRIRIRDLSLGLPELEHLAFKQLAKPKEYQSTQNGQSYQVLELRYALTASKPGTYALEPARMGMRVVQQNRRSLFNSFFDDPFSSPSRPTTVVSQALELTVTPLPEAGRPAGFSGLVGDFQILSALEPSRIKAGESATLTVQVIGRGNVNRIPDLSAPEPAHTKVYADQPAIETDNTEAGLGGIKTMKWAYVPEKAGIIEIPPLSVGYLDTAGGTYKKLETPAYTLSVDPGAEPSPAVVQSSPEPQKDAETQVKKQVQELGRDILPIKTNIQKLSVSNPVFPKDRLVWLGAFGPFLIYMVAFFLTRLRKNAPESTAQLKAKKACKMLIKQCRQNRLRHEDLIDEIRRYMNDRFRLSIGSLTSEEAVRVLRERGVDPDTAEKLRSLIEKLEQAVYTGQGGNTTDMAAETCQIVSGIEKEIR